VKAGVGPVLEAGATTAAVVAALRAANPGVELLDRGAYLRVVVPGRCLLRREDVERELGHGFRLPVDLEAIMPSFAGRFTVDDDEATWELP
jgi:hypothetical protein